MAGLGYKSFSAGDVLTAAQVQGYLQDQAVMRFADSTARASAIGTANFTEGMISYLDNTNQVEYYSGSTWASIAPVSTQGLTLLNTTSFSGVSSQSINNVFSTTYDNYFIQIVITACSATNAVSTMRLRVAGADSSTNYRQARLYQTTTTVAGENNPSGTDDWFFANIDSTNPNNASSIFCYSPFLTIPTKMTAHNIWMDSASNIANDFGAGANTASTSYTGFSIIMTAGTMTGSISVFGVNK
jgi:hypothetical protein